MPNECFFCARSKLFVILIFCKWKYSCHLEVQDLTRGAHILIPTWLFLISKLIKHSTLKVGRQITTFYELCLEFRNNAWILFYLGISTIVSKSQTKSNKGIYVKPNRESQDVIRYGRIVNQKEAFVILSTHHSFETEYNPLQ